MPSNRIDTALIAEPCEKAKAALAYTLPFLIGLSAEDHADSPSDRNRSVFEKVDDTFRYRQSTPPCYGSTNRVVPGVQPLKIKPSRLL
ncbi:MAG: hypothetical protein PHE55_08080 [Methylococcaceae bacterium]|nr:hypothetical protein [Methylococcaceae bacterium]